MKDSLRILVLDDEWLILRALAMILAAHNHHVETFDSVDDAISRIRSEEPIDVAIVDFMLHDSVDGLDVIATLQEHSRDTGVILMSGLPESSVMPAASKIPGCTFLKKPFASTAVLDIVRQTMERSRS